MGNSPLSVNRRHLRRSNHEPGNEVGRPSCSVRCRRLAGGPLLADRTGKADVPILALPYAPAQPLSLSVSRYFARAIGGVTRRRSGRASA